MQKETEKQSLWQSIYESLYIIKVCLTSFWFWVPALVALFTIFELYLLTISPWLLIIIPAIIAGYSMMWEERRTRAQYGLKDIKLIRSSDPLGSGPRQVANDIDVERLVKEYTNLVDDSRKPKQKKNSQD